MTSPLVGNYTPGDIAVRLGNFYLVNIYNPVTNAPIFIGSAEMVNKTDTITLGGLNEYFHYSIAVNDGARAAYFGYAQIALNGIPFAFVPEPLTWAMLILGFRVVGSTLRYRCRQVAPD